MSPKDPIVARAELIAAVLKALKSNNLVGIAGALVVCWTTLAPMVHRYMTSFAKPIVAEAVAPWTNDVVRLREELIRCQARLDDREAWRSNSISRVSALEARVGQLEGRQ